MNAHIQDRTPEIPFSATRPETQSESDVKLIGAWIKLDLTAKAQTGADREARRNPTAADSVDVPRATVQGHLPPSVAEAVEAVVSHLLGLFGALLGPQSSVSPGASPNNGLQKAELSEASPTNGRNTTPKRHMARGIPQISGLNGATRARGLSQQWPRHASKMAEC